jgi:transposase
MEIARLRAENARLRMERDIAKNVHRGVAPSQWQETRVCLH